MSKIFDRTKMLINEEGIEKLKNKKVAVFGVGGVGGFALEALCRAGIGNLVIIDFDTVDVTNINRQIIALHSTIGKSKVEVFKNRLLDINPNLNLEVHNVFFDETLVDELIRNDYDYIIDAIDSVKSKIALIKNSIKKDIKIISSMGMGNKLNPEKIEITDIYKTRNCPLARIIRKEMKVSRIKKLKVVYSTELPIDIDKEQARKLNDGKLSPGSISFVPSVGGLMMASYVVRDLLLE
ncbi:MAG: tRNA threonylcarbamoyladenosine dehydratase [Peptostreptococcaceae bacterium]|jgi:tRNA A37 threonylcarbamoyladenosine dehydratase|nr:tRNA threonylcarbamoyladenosine dehydratase [Peptostreptococcaceae bacterium]